MRKKAFLYTPFPGGVTNYDQSDTTMMDVKFFGPAQPVMEKQGKVVRVRYRSRGLRNVTADDNLYVLGHCAAGVSQLHSGSNQSITASQLADRLEDDGLEDLDMYIKLYACSGGSGKLFSPSYASRLLSAMRNKGYQNIGIQAYTATVSQRSGKHKRAFPTIFGCLPWFTCRASKKRKNFR